MPGQNHNISGQTLSEARSQWADGNYAGAWETLANAGDNYADNAAAVIGGDAYGGDLFSTLVRNHWENTVGADTYNQQFGNVARDHLDNYLRQMETSGTWPTTQDIIDSYSNALERNGVDPSAAFDAAWARAAEGIGGEATWGDALGMESSRVDTSTVSTSLTASEAIALIWKDFSQTARDLIDDIGRSALDINPAIK